MNLFKLDAINSTNSYLKELSKVVSTSNWTVVTAEYQTIGRGQMETKWESDRGKNLMCSILIKFKNVKIENQFYLNCAVSLGIFNALKSYNLPKLRIKWPNDIMSVNKKLGGILIENSLLNSNIYQTVVGIGINVNQVRFPLHLVKAVSMKQILKKDFDRDMILNQIVDSVKEQIDLLEMKKFEILHQNYEKVLFKINTPYMFENVDKQKFLGKILGITRSGKLIVEKENKSIQEYTFKEIKFL
jgi:BirA family transcriptional regulator, biotin operon repressor / biotin---[acetyl-CoA-carboxylase] ligase